MKLGHFYQLALLMAAMGTDVSGRKEYKGLEPEEMERIKQQREQSYKRLIQTRGVKEFTRNGITVLARDEKNAMRKIANMEVQLNNIFK